MEKQTLATELLKEVKNQSRRWFIAFIIMCILEVATVGGFFWYLTLPIDEYEITQTSDNDSQNQIIEGDYNGLYTNSEENH